ncbi:MAG: hypothetical protein RI894_1089 [Bacteroidota bacterium]|jgi:hypothetical protein
MKTILTFGIALAFSSAFAIAQTSKVALPRPTNKAVGFSEATKMATNLPHVPLKLPTVQQPTPKGSVTIHESKNPAKVSKTVVKTVSKHTPAATAVAATAAAANVATKSKVNATKIAKPAEEVVATVSAEEVAASPRATAKKYSRRTVSNPPRRAVSNSSTDQSTAAADKPKTAQNDDAPAQNWLSDSYSVDANGNKVAPVAEQAAVIEEAPAARPMAARQEAQVQSAYYGAHYVFDTETINYGAIAKGSNGKRKFRFRNDGSEPLTISSIIPGCSCVTAEAPKEAIAPGKSGFIEVEYDTTQEGDFLKDFVISSNAAGEDAVKIVYIKGHVH